MITFYDPRNPWGFFSNFSRHQVLVYGKTWWTSEHAFQAMKYWPHRPDLVDWVHGQATPGRAAQAGRDRSKPIRADWELAPTGDMASRVPNIPQPDDGFTRAGGPIEPLFARTKDVFMYEICWAKFAQYPDLKKVILDTGDQPLIEDALHDPYWGWGASHVGQNKLGRVLMAVRHSFRTGEGNPAV